MRKEFLESFIKKPHDITDEVLKTLTDDIQIEIQEWQRFQNTVKEEIKRRAKSNCKEHDFYPIVAEGWCGDSGQMHAVRWSEYFNSWQETCPSCGTVEIRHEQLELPAYQEYCKKCDFFQDGILHCKREDNT